MADEDLQILEKQLLINYCVIKHLILLKILDMMDINVDLFQWFIVFLNKNTSGSSIKNDNISDELPADLAEELNLKKQKVYSYFIDNIWGAGLADMETISKFNKGVCFLLCVIYIFSKYAWFISLKNKKDITSTNDFLKTLGESNCKPKKYG